MFPERTHPHTRMSGSWDAKNENPCGTAVRPSCVYEEQSSTEFKGVGEHTNNSRGWARMGRLSAS